ncbi:hypothetical protein [Rhizobium leguminosarum]|uniref:hypothetical protein n=1 Tax=Rhizobium leguminosarum TaxID=384 RepID=UPI003CFD7D30
MQGIEANEIRAEPAGHATDSPEILEVTNSPIAAGTRFVELQAEPPRWLFEEISRRMTPAICPGDDTVDILAERNKHPAQILV